MIVQQFDTPSELREWLALNHNTAKECWVLTTRNKNVNLPGTLKYLDVVESAICYGWIDSTVKKIAEYQVAQRISPRRKNSHWTELNKARARRLEKLGLMTEAGRKILPDLTTFELDEDVWQRIKRSPDVLHNMKHMPELYLKIKIDNIQNAKNDTVLFNKRLNTFLEKTSQNKLYGTWNDDGRLLEE